MSTLRAMAFTTNTYMLFFLISIITELTSSQARFISYDDNIMSIKHEKWMFEHERHYDTKEEKEKRFTIFKGNVEYIESFNTNNNTYELGVNAFADLTKQEFITKYAGGFVPKSQKFDTSDFIYKNMMKDIPSSLDWRNQGAVTPVKSQGGCGSCWAFSAVAAIEGIVHIKSGILTPFSEQNIMDCDVSGDGCQGGRMEKAFQFVTLSGGLASEDDYPYQMREEACTTHPSSLPVRITGYGTIPPNNEAAMLMAMANQPISVGIDPSLLQFYKSGILTGSCGTRLTHAVTAVGYDVSEDGTKFWLLKNSWGENWGENGYLRVQRDNGTPEGMCGIAMDVTFPTA